MRYCKLHTALIIFTTFAFWQPLKSQDIPLYSQKLTNSFIYNPAVAGHTFGSLTYSFNKIYTPVNGSPTTSFISAHTPLLNHKVGIGANFYNESVNFVTNTYFSGAFAYHLRFARYTMLSMGLSAEYNSIGFDPAKVIGNSEDPILADRINTPDFSFGLNFQTRYFKVGGAVNRLATNLELTKNATDVLSEFYSGYAAGMIPLRAGADLLEPTLTFRKLSPLEGNFIYDVGLFYTYDDTFLGGLSYRRGNVINATAGLRLANKLMFGYSFNVTGTDYRSALGASHEITLRYDFNEKTYQDRFANNYRNSMAFRRKTLSNSSRSRSSASMSKNKQRQIKRASPNRRYQNIKKLSKRSKPKFSVKKRQRKNFRRRKRANRDGFFSRLFGGNKSKMRKRRRRR